MSDSGHNKSDNPTGLYLAALPLRARADASAALVSALEADVAVLRDVLRQSRDERDVTRPAA